MDPAVAALDLTKAAAIIANMIESYLAGGAPLPNREGADHDEFEDGRSPSGAASLHLHSPIDAGPGPLQSRKQGTPRYDTLGSLQAPYPQLVASRRDSYRCSGPSEIWRQPVGRPLLDRT